MRCKICGLETIYTHYHHIIPLKNGGEDKDNNIIYICNFCHWSIHSSPNNLPKVLKADYDKWLKNQDKIIGVINHYRKLAGVNIKFIGV